MMKPRNIFSRILSSASCLVALLFAGTNAAISDNDSASTIEHLTLYTHGDTRFARFDKQGKASGPAIDTMQCASEQLGFSFDIAFAPLSRADSIVNTGKNALWFPSGNSPDTERQSRLLGTIGEVSFVWYQRKANAMDIHSEAFKKEALVTAYKGSAFEDKLRREGYRWTEGSADHNRLLSMVLSKKVDALLAVDFTFKLDPGMKRMVNDRLSIMPHDALPVNYEASVYMGKNAPAFVDSLRKAIVGCVEK